MTTSVTRLKVALVTRVYEEMREQHNVQQSKEMAAIVLRQTFPEMSREAAEEFVRMWWQGDV
jgi:DNA-binding transcriptional regulator YhcF (GntR family)